MKSVYLSEELLSSKDILIIGLRELQHISASNDQYYVPFQLISMALERLMKCYLCLGTVECRGKFCSERELKNYGHDLETLKSSILKDYFNDCDRPALVEDRKFIEDNDDLKEMLYILSEYGKCSRYYNLNVVTGAAKPGIDVKKKWDDFEGKLINRDVDIKNISRKNGYDDVVSEYVNHQIIILLVRFVRALSRQFTIGGLGQLAKQLSGHYLGFYNLTDEEVEEWKK